MKKIVSMRSVHSQACVNWESWALKQVINYLEYEDIDENGNEKNGHDRQISPNIYLKILNGSNMTSQENYAQLTYQGFQGNEHRQLPANNVSNPLNNIVSNEE